MHGLCSVSSHIFATKWCLTPLLLSAHRSMLMMCEHVGCTVSLAAKLAIYCSSILCIAASADAIRCCQQAYEGAESSAVAAMTGTGTDAGAISFNRCYQIGSPASG